MILAAGKTRMETSGQEYKMTELWMVGKGSDEPSSHHRVNLFQSSHPLPIMPNHKEQGKDQSQRADVRSIYRKWILSGFHRKSLGSSQEGERQRKEIRELENWVTL